MTYHKPVLLNESIKGLDIKPNGIYVDVTFGGGGHSKEILKNLKGGFLYAFDQDMLHVPILLQAPPKRNPLNWVGFYIFVQNKLWKNYYSF